MAVCQLRIPPTLLAIQHHQSNQRMNNVVEHVSMIQLFLYPFNLNLWLQNTFSHCRYQWYHIKLKINIIIYTCQCRLSFVLYNTINLIEVPAIGVCGAFCFDPNPRKAGQAPHDIWRDILWGDSMAVCLSTADSTYTAGNSTLSKDEPCHWINMFQYSSFFLFLYRFNLKNMVAEYLSPLQLPVQAQLRSVQGPSHWSLWSIVLQHKHQMKYDKWHLTSDITAAQFPAMTSDIWWHLTIPKYDKWHLTSDITAAQFPAMTSDIWWQMTSHYSKVLTAPSLTWLGTPSRLTWPGTPRRTPLTWLGTPSRLTWLGSVLLGLRSIWCWWCWQSFRSTRAQRWIHDSFANLI